MQNYTTQMDAARKGIVTPQTMPSSDAASSVRSTW